MQEIVEADGADGFVVGASLTPGSAPRTSRMVVPVLQERGLFRT